MNYFYGVLLMGVCHAGTFARRIISIQKYAFNSTIKSQS